jgi:hypothetical protein
MCTVTYIPDHGHRYILTSSRDEQTTRPTASSPAIKKYTDYKLLFPRDPKGGGTWIAVSNKGKTACLFNGAFKAHIPTPPYKHSRGLIVLDFFKFSSAQSFRKQYDLNKIEPFTLIIAGINSLEEFTWDGHKTYLTQHDSRAPRIWSSVTLYSPEIVRMRQSWFGKWETKHPRPSQSDVIDFHLTGGNGDKTIDILMERRYLSLKTVSITSVKASENETKMKYLDLLNNSTQVNKLFIQEK